jgi:uncharacterized protein
MGSVKRSVWGRILGVGVLALAVSASVVVPDDSLLDAVRQGDLDTIRALVQSGADVNAAEGDGMTALHWAAEGNHAQGAQILIYAGARLDARTRIGDFTPLLVAARVGNAEVLEVLLEAGADPHVRTSTGGMTALHFAAQAGNARAVTLLLEHGAEVDAREGGSGHTPLMVAAASDRTEAVRTLLAAGADPRLINETVDMAERQAEDQRSRQIRNQRVAMLRDLEEQENGTEAQPAAETEGEEARAEDSPAEEAEAGEAEAEEEPEAPEAVEEGSPAPPADELFGTWNISLSVQGQAVDATLVLSRNGEALGGSLESPAGMVELDVTAAGSTFEAGGNVPEVGRVTLDGSVSGRELEGTANLGPMGSAAFSGLRSGAAAAPPTRDAEVEEAGEEGERQRPEPSRPLSYAELVGGHGGFNALHLAARQGSRDVVTMLLDAGVDINKPSQGDHSTPLLIATINGHWDLALELLERGADPNIPSHAGATPLYGVINLHWAPRAFYPQPRAQLNQDVEYLDIMAAFLEAGADPNARLTKHLWYKSYNFDVLRIHSEGATPFWRAAYGTDVAAMRLLLEYGADPHIATVRPPAGGRGGYGGGSTEDASGLPPVPPGAPSLTALHAASGAGYGEGYAANAHRHVPGGWVPAARFLIEEVGLDVNARDHQGYTPLHHAAARGDTDLIQYLVDQGADLTVVSRRGQTVADMANGPVQRTTPYPAAIELLLALGSPFNDNCVSC